MNALLVRVGADQSDGGGLWNGLVNSRSGEFAYVAIPENSPVHPGLEKPYNALEPMLSAAFGASLPPHLRARKMHLDPDFEHLTYGDAGQRANQLRQYLSTPGGLIVFYAGLRDVNAANKQYLIYAIIGLFVVQEILPAVTIPEDCRDTNAHSRRILDPHTRDLVVRARPGVSGRLNRCIPIGEWRDRAYRVRRDLLDAWGGLTVNDGYLQRSARLPRFNDVPRFQRWLEYQNPVLIQVNNEKPY